MKEEKRALLAAVLSLLVLAAWFYFFGSPKVGPSAPPVSPSPSTPSVSASSRPIPVPSGEEEPGPEELTVTETPLMQMEWTSRGGRLKKMQLKDYRTELFPLEGDKGPVLFCGDCNISIPEDQNYTRVSGGSENSLLFEAEKNGIEIRKEYRWRPDQYLLDLQVALENRSDREFQGHIGLGWQARQFPEPQKALFGLLGRQGNQRSFLFQMGGKVLHDEKGKDQIHEGTIPWAGIEDRYFLISLISRRLSSDQVLHLQQSGDRLVLNLSPSVVTIPPHGRHEELYSIYLGPKERKALQGAGVGLEDAVDYGWLGLLAIPILKLLQLFHLAARNWGVAIILLTLFIKLLMNPLTVKSMRQMKEMQRLQPRLAELKEKYKNDKQRLNTETMQLFKTYQVNPMGGCLQMLFQMPIYIAL